MAYVYLNLTVTNQDTFTQYKEVAAPALQTHGCSVVTMSKENEMIDGADEAPQISVLLNFPDKTAAKAWINDPALATTHELRRNSGKLSMLLVG